MSTRLLAMILAAILVLAACGAEDQTAEDVAIDATPTEAAPTEAEETPADDAAADAEVSEQAQPVVQAVDTTVEQGSAAFDATVVVDSAEFSDQLETSGVVDFDGERRQLDLATPGGDVRALVTTDGVLLSLADTDGWLRVDPRSLQGTPLEAFGIATLPLQDPSVNLGLLRGATEDVNEVGEEDIDGETVTRYEVTADVQRAAAQATGEVRSAIESVGGQTGTTVNMEVWIDEQDRIRRITQQTDLAETELVEAQQVEGTIEVTIDLSDFGAEVDIEEPQEGEIVDIDEQTLEQLLRQFTPDDGTSGTTDTGTDTETETDTGTDTETETDTGTETEAEETEGTDG